MCTTGGSDVGGRRKEEIKSSVGDEAAKIANGKIIMDGKG